MPINNPYSKAEIRKECLRNRSALRETDVITKSNIICNKILELDEYKKAGVILLYNAYNNEVDTKLIYEDAIRKNKTVAFPKSYIIDGVPHMEFYAIHNLNELCIGYKGIVEPDTHNFELCRITKAIDLCIVPGVAFDKCCNRVGYGKAFYDRFIAENDIGTLIGICFDIQIVDKIDVDKYDHCMDMVITETSKYQKGLIANE